VGTGKLKTTGALVGGMKEAIQRAFAYLQGHKSEMGIAQVLDTTDFHVESIDLLANGISCEIGMGVVVAIYSAIKKQPVLPGMLILGDLSIQGNIKSLRTLVEALQVGKENGARKALVPVENKRHFLEVPGDVAERVDPVFYSEPMSAAMKALGLT
jgi:ATP-dependent Lon protease